MGTIGKRVGGAAGLEETGHETDPFLKAASQHGPSSSRTPAGQRKMLRSGNPRGPQLVQDHTRLLPAGKSARSNTRDTWIGFQGLPLRVVWPSAFSLPAMLVQGQSPPPAILSSSGPGPRRLPWRPRRQPWRRSRGHGPGLQAGYPLAPSSGRPGRSQLGTAGLGGLQGSFRPGADPLGFILGDGGQNVDGQLVGVRVVAANEVSSRTHQGRQESHVAGQAVQFGHYQRCLGSAGMGQGLASSGRSARLPVSTSR